MRVQTRRGFPHFAVCHSDEITSSSRIFKMVFEMSGKYLKLFLKYYIPLFNDHELIVYAGLKNNDLNLVL